MDRFDDDTLFAELRELRPTPRPEFTAELDERAAAGFPRRDAASRSVTPFTLLAERWRALSPGRRLVPVLVVGLAALVVATAVVAIAQSGTESNPAEDAVVGMVPGAGESGVAAEESSGAAGAHAAPSQGGGGASHSPSHGGAKNSKSSGETVYAPEVPSVHIKGPSANNSKISGAAAAPSASATESAPVEEAESTEESAGAETVEEESSRGGEEFEGNFFGGAAGTATHRDIERSAYVVLGTQPGEVAGAAAKVYEAVHAAHGIVLHSSVQSGKKGATGAYFELLIPTNKVDDALATFSQVAEVRERHDRTADITEATVSKAEELADSNASIEGLLKELGSVETEAEHESVEARLREERRHHAAIRGSLDHLDERASMSEVTVRIVTDHGAGVSPIGPNSDSSTWGVGDALHDAGHILTIAAGVLLIALAVLAPIALIALLIWLAARFRVRRLRERTLG